MIKTDGKPTIAWAPSPAPAQPQKAKPHVETCAHAVRVHDGFICTCPR